MATITCLHCSKVFTAQRKTRKFCSVACANRSAWAATRTRNCRYCGAEFILAGAGDANRQHCSKQCAKSANAKRVSTWHAEHREEMQGYYAKRAAKNPGMWREKARAERMESIRLLGGGCVVCGVTNPNWLHIDYIPTTRNERYRHPRHLRWIRENLDKLRLLCANHHYELTLTGQIEGTTITQ